MNFTSVHRGSLAMRARCCQDMTELFHLPSARFGWWDTYPIAVQALANQSSSLAVTCPNGRQADLTRSAGTPPRHPGHPHKLGYHPGRGGRLSHAHTTQLVHHDPCTNARSRLWAGGAADAAPRRTVGDASSSAGDCEATLDRLTTWDAVFHSAGLSADHGLDMTQSARGPPLIHLPLGVRSSPRADHGHDGALWYTDYTVARTPDNFPYPLIGRVGTSGAFTTHLVFGFDGAMDTTGGA